ncbi:GTPase-associated system all-helical protein GASH [Herbaspirillum huttiense]|uniref:GTPase-associated system all-helical protein GASH n=1 Tax=Herbaspirillum huttiense TaxID=863372 RepID=UPI0031DB33E8
MDALKHMGIAYGKLALSVSADGILLRETGTKAAAKALKEGNIAELVRAAYGLKAKSDIGSMLSAFSEADPTLALQAEDKQTSLLAGATLAYAMETRSEIDKKIALAVVTTSFGKARLPVAYERLTDLAIDELAELQSNANSVPAKRTYNKTPKTVTEAIAEIEGKTTQTSFATVSAGIVAALKGIASYAEQNALVAAQNDNTLLEYASGLEEELRVYWWVVGGWCAEQEKLYSDLPLIEASVRAGVELAEKHTTSVGLFAAPALIDSILTKGRTDSNITMSIADAVRAMDLKWRKEKFSSIVSSDLAELLPISFAMGLSAESDDAADWIPRFERLSKIKTDLQISSTNLGLQLYREVLTAKSLAE